MTIRTLAAVSAALALATAANANIISFWDFNDELMTPTTGAGSLTTIGGVSTSWVLGSPNDPAATNRALNTSAYPAQGTGSGTAGIQFNVSTVGYTDIQVSFEHRHSNTGSRWLQFQYSTDGVSFLDFGSPLETDGTTWYLRPFDLTGIAAIENNPDAAFRVVSVFAPGDVNYAAANVGSNYGVSGTVRFDLITVTGIPAPGSLALLAAGGLLAGRRRR
jgi:hypothetical protein